ncbi:MAG: hypothetical protein M1495_05895 [Bacteroidetes bacterium]|nr:hypothetical protein [Bacteroidota bacterium]
MKIKTKLGFISLALVTSGLIVFVTSCNLTTEPTAPNWDVSLNVPIAKKNYTLFDILEKKSSSISHYTTGTNNNLLYYSQTQSIDNIGLSDKLNIEPFSKSTSETIGTINISTDTVMTDVNPQMINPLLVPGTQIIVPPISNAPVTVNFSVASEFQSLTIQSGALDLNITNHFSSPVAMTISNIFIKNAGTGEIIAQHANPVVIPPQGTSGVQSIPITPGVLVKNQLSLECSISSGGSGGQVVTIPNKALTIQTILHDVQVTSATAKIPQQAPILVNGVVTIDENSAQPNKFQNVKLNGGLLNISIANNLDLDATATFTIDNLKTPQGNTFTSTSTVPRKQTVNLFNNLSLKDYSIVSLNGTPTNQVSYHVNFQVFATSDNRTVKSGDGVTGTISLNSLSVKEFVGQLKPTVVNNTRSSVSLNVKDIQNKLKFQQINLKNPIVELHVKPTANIEFSINGTIQARNAIGQRSIMTLSSRTLSSTLITPSDTVITLNPDSVSNFFGKFSQFPDSLIVYAGGTANPNYKTVDVKNTDQFSGKSKLELPLEIGISGAEFSDSVKVDLSQDSRDRVRDVNSLGATLKISNGIAAAMSFTGKMYDQYNNFLMYFPPQAAGQDTVISVNGASTDSNGNVVSKTDQTITVNVGKSDANKISRATYIRVKLKFNTSAAGNQPVRFKTDDTIGITASGSTNYHVTPQGGK